MQRSSSCAIGTDAEEGRLQGCNELQRRTLRRNLAVEALCDVVVESRRHVLWKGMHEP